MVNYQIPSLQAVQYSQYITYNRKNKQQYGFTLVELMIVIAIVAVLAAIAIPNYQQYVIKSRRGDMMTEMQNIASRIESRRLVEGVYTNINLAQVYKRAPSSGEFSYPDDTRAYYRVRLVNADDGSVMSGNSMTTKSSHPKEPRG